MLFRATPASVLRIAITGDLRLHDFPSEALGEARRVAVWLPARYDRDPNQRFPVLYLHDGQNLFDAATAFAGEWEVDETATRLIRSCQIVPVIVVGMYNAGDRRIDEYTPTPGRVTPGNSEAPLRGGGLDRHARMLVTELKPWIDANYRTRPEAQHTAIGGSSLGALASLYIGLREPDRFGMVAALSPAVWWDNCTVVTHVERLPGQIPVRIWLDVGTAEGAHTLDDARRLRDALVAKGWQAGRDLAYVEAQNAGHNEHAWAARVGPMLRFFFAPDVSSPNTIPHRT